MSHGVSQRVSRAPSWVQSGPRVGAKMPLGVSVLTHQVHAPRGCPWGCHQLLSPPVHHKGPFLAESVWPNWRGCCIPLRAAVNTNTSSGVTHSWSQCSGGG